MLPLGAAACAVVEPAQGEFSPPERAVEGSVQGLAGFFEVDGASLEFLGPGAIGVDDGPNTLPTLGVVFQLPGPGGEHVRAGLEAGGTVSWESDRGLVAAGAGGAPVVSDNDLLLVDVFAGPYGDLRLGRWRVYGGGGPLLQFASVDFRYDDALGQQVEVGGDGFGRGWYARAGIERWFGTSLIGFGMRWVEADVFPGGGVGELDLDGVQFLITATQEF